MIIILVSCCFSSVHPFSQSLIGLGNHCEPGGISPPAAIQWNSTPRQSNLTNLLSLLSPPRSAELISLLEGA